MAETKGEGLKCKAAVVMRCEAQKIYEFVTWFNVLWADPTLSEYFSSADVLYCNILCSYVTLLHKGAEKIRAESGEYLLKQPKEIQYLAVARLKATSGILDEKDLTKFMTQPRSRNGYTKVWHKSLLGCLDALLVSYKEFAPASGDVKTYEANYKKVSASATQKIWSTLWTLSPKKAKETSDAIHEALKDSMNILTYEEMVARWEKILTFF